MADTVSSGASWLQHQSADYAARAPKWTYVDEVYSGRYCDPDRIATYLPRRKQGEAALAYEERKGLLDPDLLFQSLMNTLAGQVFSEEVLRTFQPEAEKGADGIEGLGDPADPASIAGKLYRNADGEGTNYPVFWQKGTVDTLRFQRLWFLVEGFGRNNEGHVLTEPFVTMISPLRVTDWIRTGRHLTSAKVMHGVDVPRTSLEEEPKEETQYTVYTIGGYTRYRQTDKGVVEEVEGKAGEYVWYRDAESAKMKRDAGRCLPIFYVDFPLTADVAYLLAKKSVAGFNMESRRDALINTGNTPRQIQKIADAHRAERIEGEIKAGQTVHVIGPEDDIGYISPPTDAAHLATDVIKGKRENLFISAYKMYADEAAQKTATEVRHDAKPEQAFLTFLSKTMEEAENRVLFLLEQAHFPDNPDAWGQASAVWPETFEVADAAGEADHMAERAFGMDRLPLGPTGRKHVIINWANKHAVEVDEDEIDAEIGRAAEEGDEDAARAAAAEREAAERREAEEIEQLAAEAA